MGQVGRLPGGLAYVNILANMLFGAISGYKTNGWRRQSEGEWQFASANAGYTFGADQEVRAYVSGGYIHQQIPGALSLTQALNSPELANPGNIGNGRRDRFEVALTAPLDRFGIAKGLISRAA